MVFWVQSPTIFQAVRIIVKNNNLDIHSHIYANIDTCLISRAKQDQVQDTDSQIELVNFSYIISYLYG